MIILEQEKEYLVNFSSISCIMVGVNSRGNKYEVIATTNSNEEIIMGVYKTEERAKKVLEEIGICYANIEMLGLPTVKINENITTYDLKRNIAYEMPKE